MKKLKLLGVLLIVLLSMPYYLRNRTVIDHRMAVAWNEINVFWSTESPETKQLKHALANGTNMGKPMKSAKEVRDEAIRKSEEMIDKQEQQDVAGESKQ